MISKIAALIAYVCVATVVAAASGGVYLRATGWLDDVKLKRLSAVAQGARLVGEAEQVAAAPQQAHADQPSFDDLSDARELKTRHLEMREQSLKNGLERVRFEKEKLTEEKDRYVRLKTKFEEQLDTLHKGALSTGKESVRLIWENIKPKQAKEQIMQMTNDNEINEVVAILTAMPIARRAKIIGEFKSPEEVEKLGEILRLIRQGVPEVNVIEDTQQQVGQPYSGDRAPLN